MMAENISTQTKREDCASKSMAVLPSIADILGREPAAAFLPPPPQYFGQRPNPPRSNSFPTLRVEQHLVDQFLPYRGPTLPSISSIKDKSASGFPAHGQILTPPLTSSCSSSVCSTDMDADVDVDMARLRGLLDLPEPQLAAIIQVASDLLHDSAVKPAYNQGWFKPISPTNRFSERLEDRIAGKSLDELVEGFFCRDESRELYGERVSKPRKVEKKVTSKETETTEELDPGLVAKKKRREEADEAHRIAENDRRNRHRESQMESHRRCPDLAAECGAEHAKAEKKTRTQSGKGPGKDDQLWTAIYAHEMAGRVVQSVNDRRKQAETVAQLLLQFLVRHQDLLGSARRSSSHSDSVGESFLSQPGYVGRKRTRDDIEQESRRTWPSIW